MPDTYTFAGNGITILGLVGVLSTALIVVTAFRRFYNSPYNYQVKTNVEQGNQFTQEGSEEV